MRPSFLGEEHFSFTTDSLCRVSFLSRKQTRECLPAVQEGGNNMTEMSWHIPSVRTKQLKWKVYKQSAVWREREGIFLLNSLSTRKIPSSSRTKSCQSMFATSFSLLQQWWNEIIPSLRWTHFSLCCELHTYTLHRHPLTLRLCLFLVVHPQHMIKRVSSPLWRQPLLYEDKRTKTSQICCRATLRKET